MWCPFESAPRLVPEIVHACDSGGRRRVSEGPLVSIGVPAGAVGLEAVAGVRRTVRTYGREASPQLGDDAGDGTIAACDTLVALDPSITATRISARLCVRKPHYLPFRIVVWRQEIRERQTLVVARHGILCWNHAELGSLVARFETPFVADR